MSLKYQFVLILIWPIIATLLSFYSQANLFLSGFFYFVIPSLFLTVLHRKFFKKLIIATILGIPSGVLIEYFMQINNQWANPNPVLNFWKPFGPVVLDDVLWFLAWIYFVMIYFEVFIEKNKKIKTLYPKAKAFFLVVGIIFALVVWSFILSPQLIFLKIDYLYFKFGLFFVLAPLVLMLFRFPTLWGKFAKAGAYFFYISALYEITGLTLNQWTFPGSGQFIGFVEVLNLKIPLEEFFFWITLGSLSILTFYEYFDDNPR